MDRVFGALIDRVWSPLDLRTVKTLFGRRHRPRRHKGQPRAPVVVVSLDKLLATTWRTLRDADTALAAMEGRG